MRIFLFLFVLIFSSCKQKPTNIIEAWTPYDETEEILDNSDHPSPRMRYKLIQSKVLDKNAIWKNVQDQITHFTEEDYLGLRPLILEQDISTLQSHIQSGKLSYEKLTQWYLYRIVKYENDKDKTLHSVIHINPHAVQEARLRDKKKVEQHHPIYGMPILLKDNIGTDGMPTTAGAIALKDNHAEDAFIIEKLKSHGAIILGKVNLSEWAYYFCKGCPVGYSAIGGQTLNPYGRRIFETGGSSSASGTSMAANYAVAAIGTETSGSILSPSSQNSIVGLKPTIGLLSRTGIVPISSTLDTPGPMTRSVSDNAILLSAMIGFDSDDPMSEKHYGEENYLESYDKDFLLGKRLGANRSFLEDSLYVLAIEDLKKAGAEIVEFDPLGMRFDGFIAFLNGDMKVDLLAYLEKYTSQQVTVTSVNDVVEYNKKDTLVRAPYGQELFEGIVSEDITEQELVDLKDRFLKEGRQFFDIPMDSLGLDAVLSINNWNAGHAAMAKYPCLTVPMGYSQEGEPKSLTFISKSFQEKKLLQLGYAYEYISKRRKAPSTMME